ncbi:Ribonuclease H-like domain [Phytophthora cactorum]|nr:Ribonuclease H-like domain [Phytophthora cactorum]
MLRTFQRVKKDYNWRTCIRTSRNMSGRARLQYEQEPSAATRVLTRQHLGRATVPDRVYGFCDTAAEESKRQYGFTSVPVRVHQVRHCQGDGSTSALKVAHAFEECVYRPQSNGQQERSVKTVMTSVRVYVEDPLQQDWDELVERLIFAINNSMDTRVKERRSISCMVGIDGVRRQTDGSSGPEVEEKHRINFDEELLPEDSWEQEPATDGFEVEAILDDVCQCRRVPKDRCESSRSSGLVTMNHRGSRY